MPNAVITGATKGIGRAIADTLIDKGFNLAICARNQEDLETQQQYYASKYPFQKVFIRAIDVAQKDDVIAFGKDVLRFFDNELQVLVNNAGIYLPGNALDEADGQLEHVLQVNLLSAYHLTRTLVPTIIQSKGGHIFNMCSIASLQPYPGGGSYSISKYALLGFNDNLRLELKDKGVKVTAICPGAVWSNSWEGSGVAPDRIMEAQDIAASLWNAYQLSATAVVERIILRPQLGDL